MPLKAEVDAIKKNYVDLMKLPFSDLLPALKMANVVSDDQRDKMNAMTSDKHRAVYLWDNVIVPTLKDDNREPFYNFLQVLEEDENVSVKVVSKKVRSFLRPPMPQPGQPHGGQPSAQSPPTDAPQLIEVEKYLAKSSKKGTDPLPANNRNIHAVCLIRRKIANGKESGSGFIGSLTMPNSQGLVTVLVTNHHVIHNLNEAMDATYQFSYMSDSVDTPEPIKGVDLIPENPKGFYTCVEVDEDDMLLDYTMIQVREQPLNAIIIKSELDGNTFSLSTCKFDLDNPASPSGIEGMEIVTILHYPLGLSMKESTQGSTSVGHLLFYSCDTDHGSSGAPVFKVANNRLQVLALHRGSWEGAKLNFGTLITEVLRHAKKGPPARMNRWAVLNELRHRVK